MLALRRGLPRIGAAAIGATATACGACAFSQGLSRDLNDDPRFSNSLPGSQKPVPLTAVQQEAARPSVVSGGVGEISTHVISKLGKASVDGAVVRVYFNSDHASGPLSRGWEPVCSNKLSANGGIDDLVPPGKLKIGLYMIEFDFSGVDAAARRIYRKDGAELTPLNPTGFFLAARSSVTLKIEDTNSLNHLVVSVGDKELTVRPGVRAH